MDPMVKFEQFLYPDLIGLYFAPVSSKIVVFAYVGLNGRTFGASSNIFVGRDTIGDANGPLPIFREYISLAGNFSWTYKLLTAEESCIFDFKSFANVGEKDS